MIATRQQAYNIIDVMPDEKIPLIVDILLAFQRSEMIVQREAKVSSPVDFSKYMGRGRKMFADTAAINNYIKESRDERF